MPVKSLEEVQTRRASQSRTYSVRANLRVPVADTAQITQAADLDLFLENENPLGCIQGVMWVVAFNAAAFLLGFAVWESIKLLR